MIQTENLSKIYNKGKKNEVSAVLDADIVAKEGEITVFFGPSGCGKTTLMSMIGQLLTPSSGRVTIDGHNISTYSEHWKAIFRRENIGFIFQHINLLPNLNALDNVLMPLLCQNVDIGKRREKAIELLNDLGLGDRAYFKVENLSGGEQQRISVARALISEPKIIIADEPLTFVDDSSAKKITDHLLKLRDEGKTVLISTHVANLIQLGDNQISMRKGRIFP